MRGKRAVWKIGLALASWIILCMSSTLSLAVEPTLEFTPQVSKWGPDDQIGNCNYLTPDKILQAIRLVEKGEVYDLGTVYYPGMAAFPPRTYKAWLLVHGLTVPKGKNKGTDTEEFICLSTGLGTQIDGFAHLGNDGVFYNNTPKEDIVDPTGAKKFGMEVVPPIVTRGILLDMVAYKGRPLEGGDKITVEDFEGAMKKFGIAKIEPGDAVIFHTGWLRWMELDPKKFLESSPGIDYELAWRMVESGVVGVGTDQWSTEVVPHGDYYFPGHVILLGNGVYQFQNLVTADLAKACAEDNKYEFLFVFTHPKYKGTVQGNGQPIAIK